MPVKGRTALMISRECLHGPVFGEDGILEGLVMSVAGT